MSGLAGFVHISCLKDVYSNKFPFETNQLYVQFAEFLNSGFYSHSWTRAFLRRSAWCLEMRKASWLWHIRTWSAALTAPSRSCRPQPPALCSAHFGPGVGLPGPGAHYCTTREDQAHRDDISMAKEAGLRFMNLSHIHWPCHTRKAFSKVYFF